MRGLHAAPVRGGRRVRRAQGAGAGVYGRPDLRGAHRPPCVLQAWNCVLGLRWWIWSKSTTAAPFSQRAFDTSLTGMPAVPEGLAQSRDRSSAGGPGRATGPFRARGAHRGLECRLCNPPRREREGIGRGQGGRPEAQHVRADAGAWGTDGPDEGPLGRCTDMARKGCHEKPGQETALPFCPVLNMWVPSRPVWSRIPTAVPLVQEGPAKYGGSPCQREWGGSRFGFRGGGRRPCRAEVVQSGQASPPAALPSRADAAARGLAAGYVWGCVACRKVTPRRRGAPPSCCPGTAPT